MQLPKGALKTLEEYKQDYKKYLQAVIDEDIDAVFAESFEEWLGETLDREEETGEPDYYL